MSFLKKFTSKKDEPIQSYADFWKWFQQHEQVFFDVVQQGSKVEKNFFNKLSPKLAELKDGFFFLAGMHDDTTAELILTADGELKNMVFVEELIEAAPNIVGWKFTAHKSSEPMDDVAIHMDGYAFDQTNLSFYPNFREQYPDEIDITVVYHNYNEADKATIVNGVYIFIDCCIGEINSITQIDGLSVIGKEDATADLIPIEKLPDYLTWRQKEFVEKYEGIRHNTENDTYASLKAELQSGKALIAVVNTDLLEWDSKGSHPWILSVEITYDGEKNNGMPDEETYQLLDDVEDALMCELKDADGYLNIGRQTADSVRNIYFACKDFRKPSKVLDQLTKDYAGRLEVVFDIYKDKYWESFDRFRVN